MMKRFLPSLFGAALAVGLSAGSVRAASYAWVENNDLASTLTTYVYSTSGNTATVEFTGQTITNNGAPIAHAGMYLGWAWGATVDASHAADWSGYTPLTWDNAKGAFYNADFGGIGSDISLTILSSQLSAPLSLATVGDPTGTGPGWTGTPYSYATGAPNVTTSASMNVPFLDFGPMGTNEIKTYDITFIFTFANAAAAQQLNDFYVSGQGVSAVPLPASAWGGVVLLTILAVARKTMAKQASA
jgi:hypothetical protein